MTSLSEHDEVVVILKAREPARIMTAIGTATDNRGHLQFAQRWVVHYNVYLNDRRWGRRFVRVCSYFPFSARVCLNQHDWIANRLREEGITFPQCKNAFLQCRDPQRLQALALERAQTGKGPKRNEGGHGPPSSAVMPRPDSVRCVRVD
jgi:hypothetical protein